MQDWISIPSHGDSCLQAMRICSYFQMNRLTAPVLSAVARHLWHFQTRPRLGATLLHPPSNRRTAGALGESAGRRPLQLLERQMSRHVPGLEHLLLIQVHIHLSINRSTMRPFWRAGLLQGKQSGFDKGVGSAGIKASSRRQVDKM